MATLDVNDAHDAMIALATTIPDSALDWQPDEESWSLKRTLAHVAHAFTFYAMIVEEARSSGFGAVTLHPDLPGWKRVEETDASVLACGTVAEIRAHLDAAHEHLLTILSELAPEDLDRPVLLASWRPDVAPVTTTLRKRVIEAAADHLREHHMHISETLAGWQKWQQE